MNVEFWNALFQWGSVALVALTFFFGAGALWTGNRINTRQTERLVTLETDLAAAKTAMAEQQERAAKAEAALLDVQAAIAPRRLSPAQREIITSALRGHFGKIKLVRVGDVETRAFANDIVAAITAAGWSVSVIEVGILTPPRYGVSFSAGVPDGAEPPAEMVALLDGLQQAGIPLTAVPPTSIGGSGGLVVGLKPIQ